MLVCGKASALIIWSGSDAPGNTNWSDTINNWGVESFGSSDVLTIDLSLGPDQVVSTVDSSFSINSLLIVGANGTNGLVLNGAGSLDVASGGSLMNSSSSPVSVSAVITGAGSVVNNGGGILTLSGDNSYSGGTTISSGTLTVGSNTALGSGSLMLSDGTNFTTTGSGPFTIANSITLCGGGTVTLLGNSMGTTLELDGMISGSSRFEIAAAGCSGTNTVVLTSNCNNFSGGVSVDAGNTNLVVGSNNALGTGTLMLSDGNNFTTTGGGPFTIANSITLCGGGTVTLLGNSMGTTLELDGMISGSSALEIAAPGCNGTNYVNLTSGCSTFGGGIRVDAGYTSLQVGASSVGIGSDVTQGPLGIGTLMLSDGNDFESTGGSCITIGNDISLCGGGTVYLEAVHGGNMLTLSGNISGSSAFDVGIPGTYPNYLALTSGNSTFSGGIRVEQGSTTLAVGASSSSSGGSVYQGPLGTGTLMLSDGNNFTTTGSGFFSIGNAITLCGDGTVTLLGGGMGTYLELDGMINGSSALEIAAPGCGGTNIVTLTSGCSTFSGGLTVDAGNTTLVVRANGSGSAGDISAGPLGTGMLTLGSGTTLTTTMSTPYTVLNDIVLGAGSGSSTVTIGSTYESGMSGILTLMGVISDFVDPGALVINGPVDFEGNNTYSGGTTVNSTTVNVGTDTGLGSGPVTANSSTLYFYSSAPSLSDPTFNSSTVNFFGSSPTLTGLTLMCGSTINFAASSSPTIIDMNGDNPGSTNVIYLGGGEGSTLLTIQVDTDPSYYGSITGVGSLNVTSASSGQLYLGGNNTYTGQTTIGSNALVVAGNNSAFSTGPVTVSSGGILGVDTGVTIANQINLNDGGKVGGYGTFAPGSAQTLTFQNGSGLTGGRGSLGGGGDSSHPAVGTLSFGTNASIQFGGGGAMQFSIMDAGGTPGTGYSAIDVAGNLNITANSGNPFTIQLVGVDATGQVIGTANTFNAGQTYSWTLLSAGSITNFSSSAFSVDATSLFSNPTGGGNFLVSQSGNDLTLNFTPVPEPSTWMLMVSGLFAAGAAVRRRRRP